ncbi:MAG: hypothetical protein GY950_02975 [bacterium]|nr:hypothetical protein [bacterium]
MKLTCKETILYLSGFQDGELTPPLRERVETHLEQCRSCSLELQRLEQITRRIKHLPPVEPRLNFTARVMGKVMETEDEKPRWFARPSFVYSYVFILFCLLGILLNPGFKTEPAQPSPNTAASEIVKSIDYAALLAESRQLALLDVQDLTLELVYNGEHQ